MRIRQETTPRKQKNCRPVLKATNTEAVRLIVAIAVDARHRVIEVPLPRSRRIGSGGRPKVRVVGAIVVTAIGIPVP